MVSRIWWYSDSGIVSRIWLYSDSGMVSSIWWNLIRMVHRQAHTQKSMLGVARKSFYQFIEAGSKRFCHDHDAIEYIA